METKRIVYTNDKGGVSIITPTGLLKDCLKDVPKGKDYTVLECAEIPTSRLFRNALSIDENGLYICLEKSKEISHLMRRIKRDKDMYPLDIKATIPSEKIQAEVDRKRIRNDDARLQIDIDSCDNIDSLYSLVTGLI